MKQTITFIFLILLSFSAFTVNISPNGYGQAIILPYFTVNNNLNTLITVNNSTDEIKAVKVHFREGKEGKAVLTFNLYLSPQDIWTGALVPATSTIPGHEGESTAMLLSYEASCTPFLPATTGQQFLPYEIEAESDDTDLERSREGFVELIEMGVLEISSELGQAVLNNPAVANDCAALEDAFVGGQWSDDDQFQNDDILPVSGGLSANASIIDVAEGVMFAVDGLAFEKFFPEESRFHTTVGDTNVPSLADANTTSIILHQGEVLSSDWEHGFQAVSALISKYQAEHHYDIAAYIAGKTELALTFPTKRFYSHNDAPFDGVNNDTETGCISYTQAIYDRDGNNFCDNWGCYHKQEKITPEPPPADLRFCNNVQVLQQVGDDFNGEESPTNILGSRYFEYRDVYSFESGKMKLMFDQQTNSNNGHTYTGIPVIAMSFQKYTNAGAAEGLLAQYGNVNPVQFKQEITSD
jgi:hypothetical protein